jgi:hypothetical protein
MTHSHRPRGSTRDHDVISNGNGIEERGREVFIRRLQLPSIHTTSIQHQLTTTMASTRLLPGLLAAGVGKSISNDTTRDLTVTVPA